MSASRADLDQNLGELKAMVQALTQALWRCACWHGAVRVRLVRTSPAALAPRLRRLLRQCEQEPR